MVGISYTGIDGKRTSFSSASPDEAISRLQKIPGYAKRSSDQIAASLATGWRERHKARIASNSSRRFSGNTTGDKYSSGSGLVSGINSVTDVRVENGSVVTTSRKNFVSEEGYTVAVGPKKTRKLGKISTDVESQGGQNFKGEFDVVTKTVYNPSTHVLYNVVATVSIADGKLKLENSRIVNVTTAVEETVSDGS